MNLTLVGIVRTYEIPVSGPQQGLWLPYGDETFNHFMSEGSAAVIQLLMGKQEYRARGMYIEFDNAGGTISPPTFEPTDGRAYYAALDSHPTRDYLRVTIDSMSTESTDETIYPVGNRLRVFAHTDGAVGMHGKTFSSGAGSIVFGGALVAMPVDGDETQDLIIDRFYYDNPSKQRAKLESSLGLQWEVTLT